jgi:signal transduction histidine kinase
MSETKYKAKRFLIPILSLVLVSIIIIASVSSYLSISMFKNHMEEHIKQTKEEYTQNHKNRVYNEVNLVKELIAFEINTLEDKIKSSLKEKIEIAQSVATHTYETYKDTLNKEEIKTKIKEALGVIKFNDNRGYYFMYDNKTKIIFGHPLEKFIGKDMTEFRDIRGQSLMQLDTEVLIKDKIGYSKIYFNKPNDEEKEFPKITCITIFEPLDLVLGIGEYFDVIEEQAKEFVLSRFSKVNTEKDRYLVILDVHDINGGDEFATVLLNSNKPELVGNKVSDKDKDIKGNRFRKDFLTLVTDKGAGYSEYWYQKPSTKIPELKISYFYLQKDWNWIIGSGFYYEDLEKQISNMKESITIYTNNTINKTLLWISLLSFGAILIAIFVSLKIDKTIKRYTNTIIEYDKNKRHQEELFIQQSKMAAMGEMIGNIAHQWRQPLSIISMSATGMKLQKEMKCLSDEELNSGLSEINTSVQYLSSIIDDFRSFFNPSNNKVSEFSISNTITKTLNLVKAQFTSKDIEIIQNIENFELQSIENEIIQVLINILNNARDALILRENQRRLIFIDIYSKNEMSYIEIKDNAGGIPKDIINRIFEPYFTTKDKSEGTGIGLYMSEEIAKKHLNGNLFVSNEIYIFDDIEYTGAKFVLEIPNS